jgi:hypothetical protein
VEASRVNQAINAPMAHAVAKYTESVSASAELRALAEI